MKTTQRPKATPTRFAPMTADDLVLLDNEPDADSRPAELLALQEPRAEITSLSGSSEPKLTRDDSTGRWHVELGEDLVLGRTGEDLDAVPRPGLDEEIEEIFEPFVPSWSGISYHPKISAARTVRLQRRAKGKRVIPHFVFGGDDRQVYYPSTYPWRCIGLVRAWTNPAGSPAWVGTGALVGRNVVVTASHVVPWGSDPWMMEFVPGYYDGSSVVGSGVTSYIQSARGYKDHGQGDDMAVLRLYNPLGDTLGYFGYKTYNDDWEDGNYWTKCGYPGAVASGQRPSRITFFPVIDDDNDGAGVELEYRADSTPGDSGGPVFGWWNGSPYVIGAHSGGEEEYQFPFSIIKNNVAAGGSALSSLIGWARTNW